MRRIFAIWAVCLCWGILNAAPLGPFNATLLEQLKLYDLISLLVA